MMLLGGLLCVVLLSLPFSEADSLQITARTVKQDEKESTLTASPPDVTITPYSSKHTAEADLRQKRSQSTSRSSDPVRPVFREFPSLKWVRWSGTLPRWAVKVKNERTKRLDYVCAPLTGCNWAPGYYNTGKDVVCHSPCHGKEQKSSTFDVLVNENSAVNLEWVNVSEDAFPPNLVHSSTDMAVGRSSHGVGTFYVPFSRFYATLNDLEVILEQGFEVLVMKGEYSQQIYDVLYDIDKLSIESKTSIIVKSMSVTNNGDAALKKIVNLAENIQQQSTWQMTDSTSLSVSTKIETRIKACIVEFAGSVGLSFEKTFSNVKGNSVTEIDTHSLTLEIEVPPKHTCQVKMVGEQYKANVPFTAKQLKVYENGEEKTTVISGIYHGTQVGEIKAIADKCVPIEKEKVPVTDGGQGP